MTGEEDLQSHLTHTNRLRPRSAWLLDEEYTFLNHGSFGATPRHVLAAQKYWRDRMEAHPTRFMAYELPGAIREAAEQLASFVGANSDQLAFVENATVGCNAVLASTHLSAGDEIVLTDHVYPAIRKAAEHRCRQTGACLVEAQIPLPLSDPSELLKAVEDCVSNRTRLVIFDHVTSASAVIFPVRELTLLCHSYGARVLIDGAHAPGMLDLEITSIGSDYYVGNCHKWLMAPKGSAFVVASRAAMQDLHPVTISHGYGTGFLAEFDWTGTRDCSAWLSVPSAIDFHNELGGRALRKRNHLLACEAATLIAQQWQSFAGAPEQMFASMITVRIPLKRSATIEAARFLQDWLIREHQIEVAISCIADSLWLRLSAHAYNEIADYERLAHIPLHCWPI